MLVHFMLNAETVFIQITTVELWSLELACLEHQGSLELVRRSPQFPYTFNVQYTPGSDSNGSNSKHGAQGDFFM